MLSFLPAAQGTKKKVNPGEESFPPQTGAAHSPAASHSGVSSWKMPCESEGARRTQEEETPPLGPGNSDGAFRCSWERIM